MKSPLNTIKEFENLNHAVWSFCISIQTLTRKWYWNTCTEHENILMIMLRDSIVYSVTLSPEAPRTALKCASYFGTLT